MMINLALVHALNSLHGQDVYSIPNEVSEHEIQIDCASIGDHDARAYNLISIVGAALH